MKRYKLIGLTGQSGAGKSAVCEVLEENGAAVINADEIVARLYDSGSPCLKTVAAVFGEEILDREGRLIRPALADIAFGSTENTALLGSLVHPFVTAEVFSLLKSDETAERDIVVYDAPQLFESGFDAVCDAVVSVIARREIRLERIRRRDSLSESDAEKRMRAQYDEEFFVNNSDFVIENNGDEAELRRKAEALLKRLKERVNYG